MSSLDRMAAPAPEPFAGPGTTLRGQYGVIPSLLPTPAAAVKTVTGRVASDGTFTGSGFGVTHTGSTGIYTVTFAPPFSATPTVIASATTISPFGDHAVVTAVSASSFTVTMENGPTDGGFNFIAVTSQ